MGDHDREGTTTYDEGQRFARGGSLRTLLGATGKVGQLMRNMAREEKGRVGQSVEELAEQLIKYDTYMRIDTERIKRNLGEFGMLQYTNMAVMAGVIIFLHTSGAINRDPFELRPEDFDKNGPFDQIYDSLVKNLNEYDNGSRDVQHSAGLNNIPKGVSSMEVKIKFKQTFIRYTRLLTRNFGSLKNVI